MDMTHFRHQNYLMPIDCGHSQCAIWRPLLYQNSANIIWQWENIFFERGLPGQLLTDNGTVFSGEMFTKFAEVWNIQMRFQCTYIPSGNGIVDRSYQTIKCIAARPQCSIMEAVYWYNMTPKDDTTISTAPANSIYTYQTCIKGYQCCITT